MTVFIEDLEKELYSIFPGQYQRTLGDICDDVLERADEFLATKGFRLLRVGEEFNIATDQLLSNGRKWEKANCPVGGDEGILSNNYLCRTPLKVEERIEKQSGCVTETEGDALLKFFKTPAGKWRGL